MVMKKLFIILLLLTLTPKPAFGVGLGYQKTGKQLQRIERMFQNQCVKKDRLASKYCQGLERKQRQIKKRLEKTSQEQNTSIPAISKLHTFYKKQIEALGISIISSEKTDDSALYKAKEIIEIMLQNRPDIAEKIKSTGVRVAIIAEEEQTTDLPEYSDLDEFWNIRSRGFGATFARPISSGAEENLLQYNSDRYLGENIFIHEFAHTIHLIALDQIDPQFTQQLELMYNKNKELWTNTYASENAQEYWAEGVQSWFDANLEGPQGGNGIHNSINTRSELKHYDPELAKLIREVFQAKS
jgi:hypothetical protein